MVGENHTLLLKDASVFISNLFRYKVRDIIRFHIRHPFLNGMFVRVISICNSSEINNETLLAIYSEKNANPLRAALGTAYYSTGFILDFP
ncbi:hypothetical protein OSO01_02780 [Oceanobacillus sojae]|uniref:Uncharacterized protein n=1 Tax=Oceanobacillus sojae TaxID=582851 RepID=A0A511ZDM0_9BACI|nr:hypothetical protein OSO01_02780 [Oceanobacillus sojae]